MWRLITVFILLAELVLLVSFLMGRARKRRLNETALFIAVVFVVSLALHIIPYLYNATVLNTGGNQVLRLASCLAASLGLFVGRANTDLVSDFAQAFPLFSYAYLLGVVMALLATACATIEAFRNSIRNAARIKKVLKKGSCDFVIGYCPEARKYAGSCNAILLLGDNVSKAVAAELTEAGFAVLRKDLSRQLLEDRRTQRLSRCNIVCFDADKAISYIDIFTAHKKANPQANNTYLYLQLEQSKEETIRREIIEKSGCEAWIDTFSTDELLARCFVEQHPVTRYLPKACIADAAILPDTEIHIFLLGFGSLSRELYRQSILNNQLVTFRDGEYKLLPIHYHICDTHVDTDTWNITGLPNALAELDTSRYFTMPELPYDTRVVHKAPDNREVLLSVKKQLQRDNSYGLIFVNAQNDCGNIEIGAKLRSFLTGMDNFHIFVHSEAAIVEDDDLVTYFGKGSNIFSHDMIVNDSLAVMAKKLNQIYTAAYAADEKGRPDFSQYIQEKAEADWQKMDYFTLYSNLYAAMNLRVKLNLLGLDYSADGKGKNLSLLSACCPAKAYAFDTHAEKSVCNALIAQEHARWNAYHLLAEYLPLDKDSIAVKTDDSSKVRFNIKNSITRQHACLTTHKGVSELSAYLAQLAGKGQPEDYDYYVYDTMLITSAEELLEKLGYSVTERS